jgi:hypothetical protein
MASDLDQKTLSKDPFELDLTSRHEDITSGIQSIKKVYNISKSESKKRVEAAYIDRMQKAPKVLEYHKQILSSIQSVISNIETTFSETQFTFTLLKCNTFNGLGWLEINGFAEKLILSFFPPTFQYSQNEITEINYEVRMPKTQTSEKNVLNLWKKLSKVNTEQIGYSQSIVIFENFKNSMFDCCFCIAIELSAKDRIGLLNHKSKNLELLIEKLRSDSQGTNIKNEFKNNCCSCLPF